MTLTINDLHAQYRPHVTRQSYAPGTPIDGVRIVDLKPFSDDGGSFLELARCDELGCLAGVAGFQVRQFNFSELLPGSVKAWHFHLRQEDLWFVPPAARLLVGLHDLRAESPTCGQSMRFTLGGWKSQLLLIPRGVAHGAANPWPERSLMLYLVNQQFSAADSDEQRLPWDHFGAEFWAIKKG